MNKEVLIAGIGNIFFGDDAFGVEVANRLAERDPSPGVEVRDFGIRGFDLAYALMEKRELVILVDALARGGTPGTLYLFEPEIPDEEDDEAEEVEIDMHGMTPDRVLRLVTRMGGKIGGPVRVVGCEPKSFGSDLDPAAGLTPPVASAVEGALDLVDSLVREHFKRKGTHYEKETPKGERPVYVSR